MEEDLLLEGKKFISSKKAGRIFGYTNTRIGQLCRAGKIDGRLVGHTWYVTEESLQGYVASLDHVVSNNGPNLEEVTSSLKSGSKLFYSKALVSGAFGFFLVFSLNPSLAANIAEKSREVASNIKQGLVSIIRKDGTAVIASSVKKTRPLALHIQPSSNDDKPQFSKPTIINIVVPASTPIITPPVPSAQAPASVVPNPTPNQTSGLASPTISPGPTINGNSSLKAYVDTQIQQLSNKFSSDLNNARASLSAQISQVLTVTSLSNKIDRLSGITLTDVTMAGAKGGSLNIRVE